MYVYCLCKRCADSFLIDVLFTLLLIWSSKFDTAVLCAKTAFESSSWSNEEAVRSNCQKENLSLKSLNVSHWKAATCDPPLQKDCFCFLQKAFIWTHFRIGSFNNFFLLILKYCYWIFLFLWHVYCHYKQYVFVCLSIYVYYFCCVIHTCILVYIFFLFVCLCQILGLR